MTTTLFPSQKKNRALQKAGDAALQNLFNEYEWYHQILYSHSMHLLNKSMESMFVSPDESQFDEPAPVREGVADEPV